MTTSESHEHLPAQTGEDRHAERASVNRLRPNTLTFPTILVLCIAAIAPAASMLFNVPVMASQAGASVALVFVLASIGILLLSVSVVYFARRLSSAAGFSTWVRHGLGRGAAFQSGWLLLGGYSLFEAALQSTVGGSLDPLLSGVGFHLPGGWMTYAMLLTLIVGVLSYFSITTSIWVMAPFAVLEVLALIILDVAITLRGGASGHDLVHTFTPAGALVIFVITSNFASAFAMHQAMVRYCYDLGRAGIFPRVFGRTHPRWKSPHIASIAQSLFSLLLIGFLELIVQHTNPDGSSSYALGLADGTYWQQTNGTVSFGWLASIVTICILVVYVLTNIAAPFFARRQKELRLLPHIVAPLVSSVLLLLPLASYIGPALPGSIGAMFTGLGFASTPFPSNILPLFVLLWVIIGSIYAAFLKRRHPERYEQMGRIVRSE